MSQNDTTDKGRSGMAYGGRQQLTEAWKRANTPGASRPCQCGTCGQTFGWLAWGEGTAPFIGICPPCWFKAETHNHPLNLGCGPSCPNRDNIVKSAAPSNESGGKAEPARCLKAEAPK